jgi:Fe-S-cluster-containing hydrogenase component 2
MRVPVDQVWEVSDQHCTMCTECVQVCPKPGALIISTGAKGESFRPVSIGIVSTVLFFAIIGASMAMGWWETGEGCGG